MVKWFNASTNSFLKRSIIELNVAISTTNETVILIGKPMTKRLNCGIVFISIPKTASRRREKATTGKERINP